MAKKKAAAKKPAKKKPAGPTLIQRNRSVSPGMKAAFHHSIGAGKSKVKRRFFGLSSAEQQEITKLVSGRIGQNIQLRFGR